MYKDKIEFHGRFYNLRLIDFGPDWGNNYVASVQFERLLWNDECGYTSDEAVAVDEMIFYFIPTHYFNLSDEDLRKKILDEIP